VALKPWGPCLSQSGLCLRSAVQLQKVLKVLPADEERAFATKILPIQGRMWKSGTRLSCTAMPSHTVFGSLYPLATLPRSIDAVHGRTLASTVTSLTPSKKRKRSEVAVSIDGEGVNIYSVSSIQPFNLDKTNSS
jgi:hypothetical protein